MKEHCTCQVSDPMFLQDQPTYCAKCLKDIQCPAPPASDDEKRSKPIGEQQSSGLNMSDGLTLLQNSSVLVLKELEYQRQDIKEMQKSIQFLAQQVKTLVDALAEDQDPDMPLTNYLSGKPI